MGQYCSGPIAVHCTVMVAIGLVQLVQFDVDLAGHVDGELEDWPGLASTLNVCSGVECTCSSSAASLLTRMMIGSLTPACSCSLVGVTLPPLIVDVE